MTIVEAPPERTTLYYRQGASDKIYQCAIESVGPNFIVTFAYGRRGGTLQTGCKTTVPVDYAHAKQLYDRLVKEKTTKGYTPGEDGTPYQHTPQEDRSTGILPQLLNPIDEQHAALLILDPEWWAQEKLDGKRILIQRSGDTVTGINRRGLVTALPASVVAAALAVPSRQWLMDGESIGEQFHAFDLLELACINLRPEPYNRRLKSLYELVDGDPKKAIHRVDTAMGTTSKRGLWERLKKSNREGLVFKRWSSLYTPGRPSTGGDHLKLKFTATASCLVVSCKDTKRSVMLALLTDTGATVDVGCVTIPPNHKVPQIGSVVEVRYLYAFEGGSLYQPVYLGEREDVGEDSCKLSQLKYKAEEDTEG